MVYQMTLRLDGDIMLCNKIDKPLVAYRVRNVML